MRPVYSLDFWNNGPAFVKQFRFGGGAGELDSGLPSKDTDTRDPNALDVIVGSRPVAIQRARLADGLAGPVAHARTRSVSYHAQAAARWAHLACRLPQEADPPINRNNLDS